MDDVMRAIISSKRQLYIAERTHARARMRIHTRNHMRTECDYVVYSRYDIANYKSAAIASLASCSLDHQRDVMD